jgi:hypothetical protein
MALKGHKTDGGQRSEGLQDQCNGCTSCMRQVSPVEDVNVSNTNIVQRASSGPEPHISRHRQPLYRNAYPMCQPLFITDKRQPGFIIPVLILGSVALCPTRSFSCARNTVQCGIRKKSPSRASYQATRAFCYAPRVFVYVHRNVCRSPSTEVF